MLDNKSGGDTLNAFRYPENLYMLIDVYKHHWDLFIKAFAFYLFSVSVLVGFAFSKEGPGVFQKIFIALAIVGASVVASRATKFAYQFLNNTAEQIDKLCEQYNYRKIDFVSVKGVARVLRSVNRLILIAGVLYIVHVMIVEGGWTTLSQYWSGDSIS